MNGWIKVDPARLDHAKKEISGLLDMFKEATGLNSFQVLIEERLPADAVLTLSGGDIYNIVDALHDAYVALEFAPGVPPFRIVGTMKAGDPDSYMPTPEGLVLEAEDIARQAADEDER